MKNILILYPHWHPANLAGVHRPRLIGNFLSKFGWHPIVVTVNSECFEEKEDPYFEKTFRDHFEVHRVKAFSITKPRLIGDIGIRAFWPMYKKAKEIINTTNIDFIWIPIPSFYTSLLGRLLFYWFKIPYGIDYIDPWVRPLADFQKRLSREGLSRLIARFLEPIAVKRASLISGVSEPYYSPVLERNFKSRMVHHVSMPYGFDSNDHNLELQNITYPWDNFDNKCKPLVYAGAFLPQSRVIIRALFKAIKNLDEKEKWDRNQKLFFLGTGKYEGKTIKDYANDESIGEYVFEVRERYPFLHILQFLRNANVVMIIGSTEKHYTASKTFQSILSKRPLFSILHHESTAFSFLHEAEADTFSVPYVEDQDEGYFVKVIEQKLLRLQTFKKWKPAFNSLDRWSAENSAKILVEGIEKVIN